MFLATLNNPDTTTCESYLNKWFTDHGARYVTGQLEKGANGTVHLQYFLNFKVRRSIKQLHVICPRSHFEVVKKNNGADEYCNKDDTRVEGPWSFGVKPARRDVKGDVARANAEIAQMGAHKACEQGLIPIVKYKQAKQSINAYRLDSATAYASDTVRGVWIWGPPGVGKSHYARETYPDLYVKSQSKWWDGYTGQHNVLLDDHDNPCLGHFLKLWADKYPANGEDKGGAVPLMHRNFIVTSNYAIRDLYKDAGEEMISAIERRF